MGKTAKRTGGAARALLRRARVSVQTDVAEQASLLEGTALRGDEASRECDPQELWWALEDLWLRLAQACPITVDTREPRITVHGLRRHVAGPLGELRAVALDPQRHRCRCDGHWLSFVRWIGFEGADLVVQLTPPAAVQRWHEGAELAQQMRGSLLRLAQWAREPR
jgi:hypothetical protein